MNDKPRIIRSPKYDITYTVDDISYNIDLLWNRLSNLNKELSITNKAIGNSITNTHTTAMPDIDGSNTDHDSRYIQRYFPVLDGDLDVNGFKLLSKASGDVVIATEDSGSTYIGSGDKVNSMQVSGDGTVRLLGEAADWDDYEFPISNLRINPVTSRPDFDFDEVEYLFDDNSTETVVGNGHLPHRWLIGSDLKPHIHWAQESSGEVTWQLEYKLWNNGDSEPSGFTTLQSNGPVFSYVSGSISQITALPSIDASLIDDVSPNLKVRVSRLGASGTDTYVGDARFWKFDIHYQVDSFGSREEYLK